MIRKEELLHKLRMAIVDEEKATPLYLTHLDKALPWYGFTPSEERLARDILTEIAKDTGRHQKTLEKMYESIMEAERNVY